MDSDPRCCGTGTCIINAEGICWCGQIWDGEKMCMPVRTSENLNVEDSPEANQLDDESLLSNYKKP